MGETKVIFIDTQNYGKDKSIALATEKFYNLGERVLILTSSRERGEFLDDYLWTFKQQSFLPHTFTESETEEEPIVITLVEKNLNGATVLILDTPASLDFIRTFPYVVDFADRTTQQTLQDSRKRFKLYKNSGLEVRYEESFI